MKKKTTIAGAMLVVSLAVLAVRIPTAIADRASEYAFFDPISDVLFLVKRHFLREPDFEAMRAAAIEGMLEALDDPYTEFIPAADLRDFDKDVRGSYVGIGAEVTPGDGFLRIASPMDGSPAYRSGIEAEDLVVAVDGESVFGLPIDDIIDKLLGEPGTVVVLTMERDGDETDHPAGALEASVPGPVGDAPGPGAGRTRFDLAVTRDRIRTQTIKGLHREGEGWSYWVDPAERIAYVRVSQFTETTVPALGSALAGLVDEGMRGLILDLRFNTGGSLGAAISMADMFLRDGVIVSTKGRASRERVAGARRRGTLPDFPMIVLANAGSASASEIVAGALADNGRAVILGERTFGKGSVQSLHRLPSGVGQLKMTEAYYYLPSGRLLHRTDDSTEWGVDPSPGFYVPMTPAENREMWRVRREEEVLRPADQALDGEWSDPAWVRERLKDRQLSAAIDAIVQRLDTGDWVPTGDEAPEGTLSLAALRDAERRQRLLRRELDRVDARIEALSGLGASPDDDGLPDLLPDDADLTGGSLHVYDADGNVVATLSITGPSLEPWLVDAPVAPGDGDEPEAE